jgi:hypothetical protein
MMSSYLNPLRGIKGLRRLRVDQGVDYAGSGPIYAIGPAVVEHVIPLGGSSGWPGPGGDGNGGYVRYRLTAGPAKDKRVFVAENLEPRVRQGEIVDSTTVVCTLFDASPNCELGWASGNGTQAAHAACNPDAPWKQVGYTAMGDNFNKLIVALGGPSGVYNPGGKIGRLCPGFPETWDMSQPVTPVRKEQPMSLTVADFKNPGTPKGRTRFVQLIIDDTKRQFHLVPRNGAKIANHPAGGFGIAVTQASNGKVLGVEPHPDGVHFVVTAEDGGTFSFAFTR